MTTAAAAYPILGHPPIGKFFTPEVLVPNTNYKPLFPLGQIIGVNDPHWGGREMMYCQFPASTAVDLGTIVVWGITYSCVAVPSTANLNQPVGVVLNAIPSNAQITYGWVCLSGMAPVKSTIAFGSSAQAYISGTAGIVFPTLTAGKQIVGMRSRQADTQTVPKLNTQTFAGSNIIKVPNTNGWFIGVVVSGTGISASAITAINGDDRTVTLASNSTATGSVTATGTYNDASTEFFPVMEFDRPFAQGNVT